MRCYGMWFGGSSYAPPSIPDDVEAFDSIRAAVSAFESRLSGDPYYPCVSDSYEEYEYGHGSEMWIFLADPRESGNTDYPDRLAHVGPRGGTVLERC